MLTSLKLKFRKISNYTNTDNFQTFKFIIGQYTLILKMVSQECSQEIDHIEF